MNGIFPEDLAAVERCHWLYEQIRGELAEIGVGLGGFLEQVMIALLSRGHLLVEAAPGLGKSRLIAALARCLQLDFAHIQCTPDLTIADLVGVDAIREHPESGRRDYLFLSGPLVSNLVMVEELTRAPRKTQAAVTQAMARSEVLSDGRMRQMPAPFCVIATQNPRDQEGDAALTQTQLDRFMFSIRLGYPSASDERRIILRETGRRPNTPNALLSPADLATFQDLVLRLPIDDRVLDHAWNFVRATRAGSKQSPEFIDKWVAWGAGPRGAVALIAGAKARAVLHRRPQAELADVQALLKPALRHRIAPSQAALAHNLGSDQLIDMLSEAMSAESSSGLGATESAAKAGATGSLSARDAALAGEPPVAPNLSREL